MNLAVIIHSSPKSCQTTLNRCLKAIREIHPTIPGILVGDGTAYWHWELSKLFGFKYLNGESLSFQAFGAFWVKRMLIAGRDLCQNHGADIVWKLEPDTRVLRNFRDAPPNEACFGHIYETPIPHIHGGSIFFRYECIDLIIDAIKAPETFWALPNWLQLEFGLPCPIQVGKRSPALDSSDLVILHLLKKCNLPFSNWREIASVNRSSEFPTGWSSRAVIHPSPF